MWNEYTVFNCVMVWGSQVAAEQTRWLPGRHAGIVEDGTRYLGGRGSSMRMNNLLVLL